MEISFDAKPDAPATARNREPIAAVLAKVFADRRRVLEIGSGTGQHAVYFAQRMPHLVWQTSDRPENLDGIRAWLTESALPNTPDAMCLDVNAAWPEQEFDAVFSANTLHIMSWPEVTRMFVGVGKVLSDSGKLVVYGPFNDDGVYSSESNRDFDLSLKADAPHRGIRDVRAVDALARLQGLRLQAEIAMPANNRCLVWQRELPSA